MKAIPKVKTVMSPFPYTIDHGENILVARELMREHKIRHLPVTENEKLVGLISDRDVNLALSISEQFIDERHIAVGDVCTAEPYAVDLDQPIDDVLATMAKHQIGSAIVVKNAKPVGIFTTTDGCRLCAEILREQFGPKDPEVA